MVSENSVMYSDPTGLAPKKEKREAGLLWDSSERLTIFDLINAEFEAQMHAQRAFDLDYQRRIGQFQEDFQRWQDFMWHKSQGGRNGAVSGGSYGVLQSDQNKTEEEKKEANNDRGNLEDDGGDGEKSDKTDEQKSKELGNAQLGITIPSTIKGMQEIVFKLNGVSEGALKHIGYGYGIVFVIIDLGLEYANKGEISTNKRNKAIATTGLLFINPVVGVPAIILINLPGDNITPGLKYQNPNDNTGVRINYNRKWGK